MKHQPGAEGNKQKLHRVILHWHLHRSLAKKRSFGANFLTSTSFHFLVCTISRTGSAWCLCGWKMGTSIHSWWSPKNHIALIIWFLGQVPLSDWIVLTMILEIRFWMWHSYFESYMTRMLCMVIWRQYVVDFPYSHFFSPLNHLHRRTSS
jgi:hypothetical protein